MSKFILQIYRIKVVLYQTREFYKVWFRSILYMHNVGNQPLSCWTRIYPAFENSVDPDQLASEEANWYGFALFVIKYMNL